MPMNRNDRSLLRQMIAAGRFNEEIHALLVQLNEEKSKALIQKMGTKWCLHPANAPKKLSNEHF